MNPIKWPRPELLAVAGIQAMTIMITRIQNTQLTRIFISSHRTESFAFFSDHYR